MRGHELSISAFLNWVVLTQIEASMQHSEPIAQQNRCPRGRDSVAIPGFGFEDR